MKKEMIYLGADHAGFKLKEKIKKYLDVLGSNYEDLGGNGNKNDDFYCCLRDALTKNINLQNEQGNTILHYVMQNTQEVELVQLLIEHGANPSLKNKRGIMPSGFSRLWTKDKKKYDIIMELCQQNLPNTSALELRKRF